MWDLPRSGIETVLPALAGGRLTTGPPGKYQEGIVFLTSGPETTEQPYAKNK